MIIYRGLSKLLLCSTFVTVSSLSHGMELSTTMNATGSVAIKFSGQTFYPECRVTCSKENPFEIYEGQNWLGDTNQLPRREIEISPLEQAIKDGNFDEVKKIYKKNPKLINKPNQNGEVPLLMAIAEGNLEIAQFFYEEKQDKIHSCDKSGNNALHIAAYSGYITLMEWLYKISSKLAGKHNKAGELPIHLASTNGYLEILKFLLGKDPSSLCELTDENANILHCAVLGAEYDVVEYLYQNYPILLNNLIANGKNALLLCAQATPDLVSQEERTKIFKLLVNKTRNVDGKKIKLITEKDIGGNNALTLAVASGNIGIVKYLYEYHKGYLFSNLINDVNKIGYTALHYAVNYGFLDIVKLLCEYSPKLMEITNKDGQTPAMLSKSFHNIDITNFLEGKAQGTTITPSHKKKRKKKKTQTTENATPQQGAQTLPDDNKSGNLEKLSLNIKEAEEILVMPNEYKEILPFLPENLDISQPMTPLLSTTDLMVSGEGEVFPENKTNNQAKSEMPRKTLLRTRSVIKLPKPSDENTGEDSTTRDIKDKKPKRTLTRTLSVKKLPLPMTENTIQTDDKSGNLKPSDKKSKKALVPSFFRGKDSMSDKKPETDKKDKKKSDKSKKPTRWDDIRREKKRNKSEKPASLVLPSHEEGSMYASEESSFSEVSESENEHILQFPLAMTKPEKSVLDKIFDITKPEISENEFIDFCASEAMKDIIRGRKTTSGFLIKFKDKRKWIPASTHWEHGGNKTGLDPAFISDVKKILSEIGVTPDMVIVKLSTI